MVWNTQAIWYDTNTQCFQYESCCQLKFPTKTLQVWASQAGNVSRQALKVPCKRLLVIPHTKQEKNIVSVALEGRHSQPFVVSRLSVTSLYAYTVRRCIAAIASCSCAAYKYYIKTFLNKINLIGGNLLQTFSTYNKKKKKHKHKKAWSFFTNYTLT